jgi:hypothetical protein
MRRQVPFSFQKIKAAIGIQKMLKQVLFYPPNVSGWPYNNEWIDSSTLLFRMKFPKVALGEGMVAYNSSIVIDDEDVEEDSNRDQNSKNEFNSMAKANSDWQKYIDQFNQPESAVDVLELLLTGKKIKDEVLLSTINAESDIRKKTIFVFSLPEYQYY